MASAWGETFATHKSGLGFHNGQPSYFDVNVLEFAEPGHMQFFKPLLTWVMIKSIVFSVTVPMFTHDLSHVQRLRYVHHSQATPIISGSRLLIQLHWATSHFDSLVKYLATGLLHCSTSHACIHSTFDDNSASLEHRLMSLKGCAWCS